MKWNKAKTISKSQSRFFCAPILKQEIDVRSKRNFLNSPPKNRVLISSPNFQAIMREGYKKKLLPNIARSCSSHCAPSLVRLNQVFQWLFNQQPHLVWNGVKRTVQSNGQTSQQEDWVLKAIHSESASTKLLLSCQLEGKVKSQSLTVLVTCLFTLYSTVFIHTY